MYTIEIKNNSGDVISSKDVTANQIAHLQKASSTSGKSVVNYFWEAVSDLLKGIEQDNKAKWLIDNDTYVEAQSREV